MTKRVAERVQTGKLELELRATDPTATLKPARRELTPYNPDSNFGLVWAAEVN